MLSRSFVQSQRLLSRGLITPAPCRSFAAHPRKPLESTTFSDKSSPREVYERPETSRGMPPEGAPSFSKRAIEGDDSKEMTLEEAFSGPSRPRLVYAVPSRKTKELPRLGTKVPLYILLGTLGLSAWGIFLLYATNAERLASSAMRSVQFHLRHSPDVSALLGKRVRLEEPPWFIGDPWISGTVNTMQGRIDLSFRVRGDDASGTIYFTSIRPHQGDPWRILRYKLITDSGTTVRLEDKIERITDNSAVEKQLSL
ncbi:cytochrome oxidase complex assembly protein 1-domain-containing protein [Kockovaella imperatae]|uniref:Cytochrome oxidase complex assembly protein 1-domain-containing protein n=1 Tax=Kockovaella imperatae TaxID=4999 RepID=A0A1Y1U6I8_9TREE|nr:cytochrome oxidase complex assembly protein 1-domain-containing protein [Kockovaella imperatae]ORX33650.1 cytochrome oxidase complex assembly protein 1-domain-containing protein [Kockovaella imperatae]